MLSCAVFTEEVRATELATLLLFIMFANSVSATEFAVLSAFSMFAGTCALTLYAFTLLLTMLTLGPLAFCLAFDAGLAAPTLVDGILINEMAEGAAV